MDENGLITLRKAGINAVVLILNSLQYLERFNKRHQSKGNCLEMLHQTAVLEKLDKITEKLRWWSTFEQKKKFCYSYFPTAISSSTSEYYLCQSTQKVCRIPHRFSEAAIEVVYQKIDLKILQNPGENTNCAWVSFLMKLQGEADNFINRLRHRFFLLNHAKF